MTKIAFDMDILNERGTSTAAFDYAQAGRQYAGIEPVIFYRTIESDRPDEALARFSKSFETIKYTSEDDMAAIIRSLGIDVYYKMLVKREASAVMPGVFNAFHAIFDLDKPFGDAWAYVSSWLSEHASGARYPVVPHIVNMPSPEGDLRRSLNIPDDATVIGRYGGFYQFDIPFTHQVIMKILEERKDIYFLFANTLPFGKHERLIHMPVIYSIEEKARFIATCDWMLHARYSGESFGLAMAEFLALGCPVMCWAGGWDKYHLRMQPDKAFIYKTRGDLYRMLSMVGRKNRPRGVQRAIQEFSPENVWKKWEAVFLKPPAANAPLMPIPLHARFRRKVNNRLRKGVNILYSKL